MRLNKAKEYNIYHVDFSKIRSGKEDEDGNVNQYWYSKNWNKWRQSEFKPTSIPAYNKNSKETRQLLYVKEYRPGLEYYPLPSYIGALRYIEIDTEIANFHLSHIQNGMAPGMMITFVNGVPTEDQRKAFSRQITNNKEGGSNAGKTIVNYAASKDTAPIVTTLAPPQLDKQFIQLQDTVLQNILSGHKITSPLLVGIKTEGQLGGNNELEIAFQIYNNQVIQPIKENLLKTFNTIGSTKGMKELYVKTIAPIEFMWSENVLQNIMSKDEMREKISLDPIPVEPVTPPENNIITNE